MKLHPGTLFAEKYRIERLLGEGGMGAVFVAENTALRKRVAIKVLGEAVRDIPGANAVERFMREGMSASQVRHPAIVEVYDAGVHEGLPWLAMELLSGESLRARLDRVGKLDRGEAIAIVAQALGGLAAVHEQGIIHRDLKPDNLFLEAMSDGMRVKILDFGIAKNRFEITNLTSTGAVLGTAFYLAPEQAKNASNVDHRCDLYAIGAVLYECLAGRTPFDADTITELIAKLFTETPPNLRTFAPDVPPELAALVHSCLEREPSLRPASAREFLTLLQAHGSQGVIRQPPPTEIAVDTRPQGGVDLPPTQDMPGARDKSSRLLAHSPGARDKATAEDAARSNLVPVLFVALGLLVVLFGGAVVLGSAFWWWRSYQVVSPPPPGIYVPPPIPSTPGAAIAVPELVQWSSVFEPLLAHTNSPDRWDIVGAQHVLAGGSNPQAHLAAIDGKTGALLWRTDAVLPLSEIASLRYGAIDDLLLAATGLGKITAFSLRDGRPVWEGTLTEKPAKLCRASANAVAVMLTDDRVEFFATADGNRLSGNSPCTEASEATARLPNTMNGPWVWGTWTPLEEPPPVEGMRAESAYRDPDTGQVIIFGTKASGSRVPMIASRGRIAWEQIVPKVPLGAQEGTCSAAAFAGDRVLVGFGRQDGNGAFLSAFRLQDGERLFETAFEQAQSEPRSMMIQGTTAYVSHWTWLEAFRIDTGESVWRVGKW